MRFSVCTTLPDLLGKVLGVPIGQANAAVALSFADLARVCRTMKSITLSRKADPYGADRIVRTRVDRERGFRPNALKVVVGIVPIGWIIVDADDLQRSARRRLFLAADCRRIKRDEIACSIEGFDSLPLLVDDDLRVSQRPGAGRAQ